MAEVKSEQDKGPSSLGVHLTEEPFFTRRLKGEEGRDADVRGEKTAFQPNTSTAFGASYESVFTSRVWEKMEVNI